MGPSVAAAGLLTIGCAGTTDAPPPVSPSQRPNFLIIINDDLDYAIPRQMPQIERLITQQGVLFSNSFGATPVCCPARASMLTGLFAHNHGVILNTLPDGGFERFRNLGLERSTLVTWLQAAGYRTALVGKYLNRYPGDTPGSDTSYVPPGWNDWYAVYSDRGSDAYYDYFINENLRATYYGKRDQDYLTDVLAGKAVNLIKSAGDQPLLLWFAPSAPHRPAIPAPRHVNAFAGAKAPRTLSFNEADMSDKPAWYRDPKNLPLLNQTDIEELDALYRSRLASMLAVDDAVAQMIAALEATGKLSNTYIIFTSDNGFQNGQHRFPHGKDTVYEPSIRLPLMMRGPGIPAGVVRDQLVSNVDFTPTVCELAGIQAPTTMDGRSLVPLFRRKPPIGDEWRRELLIEHWADTSVTFPSYAALRTRDGIYVRHATQEIELYNLNIDPDEMFSLHPYAPSALLNQFSARLDAVRNCRGAACP